MVIKYTLVSVDTVCSICSVGAIELMAIYSDIVDGLGNVVDISLVHCTFVSSVV